MTNGAPAQTAPGPGHGSGKRGTMVRATLPRRMQASAEARPALTKVGTSTCRGHNMVNKNMRSADRRGRWVPQGRAAQGGAAQGEEGWRASAKGSPEKSGEAGCPEQRGWGMGVEDPPPLQHNKALSVPEGGRSPPQRKERTYRASPLQGRTCHCGRSMETSLTTVMGHTW